MALTPSVMTRLGSQAPDFKLKDVVLNQSFTLDSFKHKKAFLVMFICRHCPFVQYIKDELSRLDKDHTGKDIAIVAISSNDAANYPDDSPAKLKELALEQGWHFPLLHDETQDVAKRYQAACTPDFFLYDKGRKLVYRGQMDDSRPGNEKPLDGRDLRAAIDAVLTDKPQAIQQKASIGCNIKWKKGNEPEYFKS